MSDLIAIGVMLGLTVGGYMFGSWMSKLPPAKQTLNDSLIAEAYSEVDRCPHACQRGELRGVVDAFAQRIADLREHNHCEAERLERRRLAEWVQVRRLGS
jgi:hypothetical protein